VSAKRVRTYVRGLDEQLEGGIPTGSITLIAGKPGTMKSSIAYSILYNNAKIEGRSGIYVTLEQSRDNLVENMAGIGMDPEQIKEKLNLLDLSVLRRKLKELGSQTWLEVFKTYIRSVQSKEKVGLLVIDSLPVLQVMAKFENPRDDLFKLFEWVRELDITAFLITEMQQDSPRFAMHGEDFLSDGIIHMDLARDERSVNLFLSVIKLRRTHHPRDYFPVIFDKSGFEIVTH